LLWRVETEELDRDVFLGTHGGIIQDCMTIRHGEAPTHCPRCCDKIALEFPIKITQPQVSGCISRMKSSDQIAFKCGRHIHYKNGGFAVSLYRSGLLIALLLLHSIIGSSLYAEDSKIASQSAPAGQALGAEGMHSLLQGNWDDSIKSFSKTIDALQTASKFTESQFFYELQSRRTMSNREDIDTIRMFTERKFFSQLHQLQLRRARNDSSLMTGRSGKRIYPPPPPSYYEPTGYGLIGGTTWIYGLNVPVDKDVKEFREKSNKMLEAQAKAAGKDLKAVMNTEPYNFILGVATSHSSVCDLLSRVMFGDELTEGNFSAENAALYHNLIGRQFDLLDCHSNGAMVCLAALMGEFPDAKATKVRLLGPQVTAAALNQWQRLIEQRKVQSVEIYINEGDPVPILSYLLGQAISVLTGTLLVEGLGTSLAAMQVEATQVPVLRGHEAEIRRKAPGIQVTFLHHCPEKGPLGYDLTLDCHSMARYQCAISQSCSSQPQPASPKRLSITEEVAK